MSTFIQEQSNAFVQECLSVSIFYVLKTNWNGETKDLIMIIIYCEVNTFRQEQNDALVQEFKNANV